MGAALLALQSRQDTDPHSGALWTSPALNVRPVELIDRYKVPDPIRDGFDTPCRPARWPIVTFQNRASIMAVQQDDFGVVQSLPHHTAAMPRGYMVPMGERANIQRTQADAYGNLLMALRPHYPA